MVETLARLAGKPKLVQDQYFVDNQHLVINERLNTNSYYLFLGTINNSRFEVKYSKIVQDYYVFSRMNDYIKYVL